MGGSNGVVYEFSYQHERSQVRAALIKKFEEDPHSQDVMGKIKVLRALLIEAPHINMTAAQEESKGFDVETGVTSLPAAFNELDRLFTLYETSTILRSVQCRMGNVACPLGHYASYFDDFKVLAEGKKVVECNICGKKPNDGYHCSYCFYSLCVPCSVVYCSHGHACKLWTHAESQHSCIICHKQPVTSGYRCLVCEDYDVCDYCTWKDGRKVVQDTILARAQHYLDYIDSHQDESETAVRTIKTHKQKMAENSYATLLEVYQFGEALHELKDIVKAEVIQTRITRAIIKLRAELVIGKEFSKIAHEESLVVDNYTKEELQRLTIIHDRHCYLRSIAMRSQCPWACPLGHAYEVYSDAPPQYYRERLFERQLAAHAKQLADEEAQREAEAQSRKIQRRAAEERRKKQQNSLANKVTSLFRSQKTNNQRSDAEKSDEDGNEDDEVDLDEEEKKDEESSKEAEEKRNKDAVVSALRFPSNNDKRGDDSKDKKKTTDTKKNTTDAAALTWQKDTRIPRYRQKAPDFTSVVVHCSVCGRLAQPSGYHCDYCEYDVCDTCAVVFDHEGHPMVLWTEPDALDERCFLCHATGLTRGYHCAICTVNLCDLCTTKSGRARIRTDWEAEMNRLIAFMQENKRLSDVAMYYQWRFANHIVSIGRLVEYVHELRTAKHHAELQIAQKPIIDKIKTLRRELAGYMPLCAVAVREVERQETFVFPNKAAANAELRRLAEILRSMYLLQAAEARLAAGIACPLGHAMDVIAYNEGLEDDEAEEEETTKAKEKDMAEEAKNVVDSGSAHNSSSRASASASVFNKDQALLTPLKESRQALINLVQDTMLPPSSSSPPQQPSSSTSTALVLSPPDQVSPPKAPTVTSGRYIHARHNRSCRVCASTSLWTCAPQPVGHRCRVCEYDLCGDCSTIFCRAGHPLKIWTMPEAVTLHCDMCKLQPLTSGYRCTTCNIDICDGCTSRDARNAFLLWPRREFHAVVAQITSLAQESPRAQAYLDALHQETDKSYLETMSKLCRKLAEVTALKTELENELKEKVKAKRIKGFAVLAREMI